ncbi:ribonuclease P protein component [Fibrisoma limi BUZ 3]|uniref:Ribonuclease P protein component n=1 Tax=Fibrisoma limi BUZ 3 TaxID=1185876 RepID=I2GTH2_9BACT|nr:ribonuclease P protein component [Fibrisoma limi]CCH57201.1 ribonuclease P protein component [Fibrisoma limi BUZ 3]
MRQTFTKSERLCSKKVISQLFEKGSALTKTFYLFPFRVLYLPQDLQGSSGQTYPQTSDPQQPSPEGLTVRLTDASQQPGLSGQTYRQTEGDGSHPDETRSDGTSDRSHPSEILPAILIVVSKRNFKRAVDRNLIRRRVREAYRLNKSLLFRPGNQSKQPPAAIAFLYTAKAKISFEEIEKGMKLALQKL